jgi:lipopolysaccharide export system permease protein
MSILPKYILTEYLKFLLILLAALLVIFCTIYFLERINWFSQRQVPFFLIVEHLLLRLPKMVSDLMPLALFLSSLLTLGTLAKNNEIIPMMSAGISIVAITAPILLVGLAMSGIFFFLNGSVIPSAYKAARVVQKEWIEKKGMGGTLLQNKIWIRLNGKTLLYTRLVDAKKNRMHGVHFYYLGSETPITAEIEAETLHHEKGRWILSNGVDIRHEKDGTTLRTPFSRKEIQIGKTLLEMQQIEVEPDEMTYAQLESYVDQLKKDGLNSTRHQVDLGRKYAFSLSHLIVVFLGITIALRYLQQGGISKSVLVGLVIFLLYWLSISVCLSMGKTEVLTPVQAVWGPHILFLLLGGYPFFHLHRASS